MKRIDAGFDVDVALIGAVQAAELLNKEYGDWVDASAVANSIKEFLRTTDQSFKCRSCGWRQKDGTCPANQNQHVNDNDTCGAFLHVHEYVDEATLK